MARQRGNRWEERRRIQGKQVSFYGATEQEAIQKADTATFLNGLRPLTSLSEEISLEQFIVSQVVPLYASLSRDSINKAAWAFERIAKALGRIPLRQLSPGQVTTYLNSEAKESYWTIHAIRSHLSRALKIASRMQLIPYNYVEGWRIPKSPPKRTGIVSALDGMAWVRSLEGHWAEPWAFCCLVLGCGRSEPLGITLDHIGEDCVHIPGTKNENRDRVVYPGPTIMAHMRGYAWKAKKHLVDAGKGQVSPDWGGFRDRGMPTPHSLRHTFATGLEMGGCPRSVRMHIMGQSLTGVVGDLYVHPSPKEHSKWMEKWAEELGLKQEMEMEAMNK